ncbi:MAG: UDP-N-acetyl-D-mannosamine dehydrogenase, partial [Muribaculaceae bacterium]|nr:UDP-N-acetyl-D-mannosamine dehydrogenase [Muribaculaceae bacterium]
MEIMISEPNIKRHPTFKLTNYTDAFMAADLIVFLVGHSSFKNLPAKSDKIILDFCGVLS